MNPTSPITGNNNTNLTDTFSSKDIIALYKQQLNIDVAKFFSNTSSIHLYQCNDTGYKFYHPQKLDGDGKFYEALQNELGEEYYHTWKFENQLAFETIQPNEKVLDIGCGVGNFLISAKKKTDKVFGLELNEKAVSVCESKGLSVYNQTIQHHAEDHKEYYDVVCMFQVLEHVYDVKDFIQAALQVLKPGGKLIIGVPNNEPYFLGYDKYCTLNLPPHHMGLWNKQVFEKFASLFNLSILKMQYDNEGRVAAEAYLRAKYIAGIKSLPGKHTRNEKLKMGGFALYTFPATVLKKISKGLNGSHIAVIFKKN